MKGERGARVYGGGGVRGCSCSCFCFSLVVGRRRGFESSFLHFCLRGGRGAGGGIEHFVNKRKRKVVALY